MSSIEEDEVQVTILEQVTTAFWSLVDIIPFELTLWLVPLAAMGLLGYLTYQGFLYYSSL
jgi:hypothetical protein